jgi:hypothetical protein
MAALGPVRRMLLYGILSGALTFAAPPSGATAVTSPAPAVAVEALLHGDGRGDSKALLRYVHLGRFCNWHFNHPLCSKVVILRRLCDQRPDHRFCDDDDDRFCEKRADHPLCDDDRFCKKRSDHPLCDGDQSPSPS